MNEGKRTVVEVRDDLHREIGKLALLSDLRIYELANAIIEEALKDQQKNQNSNKKVKYVNQFKYGTLRQSVSKHQIEQTFMRFQCSHVNRRAMEKKLLEWINSNLGKVLESPRKEVFKIGSPPQNFKIVEVNENKKRIKVKFMKKGTLLPLEFWRFDKVIELIARGDWIRLGTSLKPDDPSTIEWKLQEHAKKLYGRKTDFKTAPHIGDILVLSGMAKYDYARNPHSNRKNQALKKV